MGGPARPSAPRAVLDLPGTPDLQTRPTAPSTEPFFVTGFAPKKNCPRASRCRKILQTTWHKAYSEYPPFTHKVHTTYPQALALQSPQYRIILYPDRSEPLDIGVRAKSHTKVNPQDQAIFRVELQVISAAKPLLRRRPRQALQGVVRAWVLQARPGTHQQQFLGSAQNL